MDTKNIITGDNAADRMTYAGEIFSLGEKKRKQEILDKLPQEWSDLHKNGYIHIHDLDAYGFTYNCLAVDLRKFFPYENYIELSQEAKITGVFDFVREFLIKLGNEQSGGMAFANFDIEIADVLLKLGLSESGINDALLRASVRFFFVWCNNSHDRMGKVSYYVSLNIGLAKTEFSRYICIVILEEFASLPATVFKPNIVFKVKKGINSEKNDAGYSLFQAALKTTTIKMIPTYILCDAAPNKDTNPETLAIMGCRTRVVDNKNGISGSVGRGNITNISVNLPRIAMEIADKGQKDIDALISIFCEKWDEIAAITAKILEARYDALINNRTKDNFNVNAQYNLWCVPFRDPLNDVFKNGTLSIGFIGLCEAVEVLTGKKYYKDDNAYCAAKQIVNHMRDFINTKRSTTMFNYSLLATSGEFISGKFTDMDIERGLCYKITKKGFYTNSFHVEVDSGLTAFDKLAKEAPFHMFCNGGCISYVEFKEAPINNESALEELINHGIKEGIHYLGFNFDLDICGGCGYKGIFDKCPKCNSDEIIKIRRVSGYLEILSFFTKGKKMEVKRRMINKMGE